MKKSAVLFSVLVVYTLFITVFSNVKSKEAIKMREMAEKQKDAAEQATLAAEEAEQASAFKLREIEDEVEALELKLENCR
jgi:predicted Holliday junction resolvase-like endonuclease